MAKKGDKDYDPLASRVNQNRLASGRIERAGTSSSSSSSTVPSLAIEDDNPPSTGKYVSFILFYFCLHFILAGEWQRLAPAGEGPGWQSRVDPAKAQH